MRVPLLLVMVATAIAASPAVGKDGSSHDSTYRSHAAQGVARDSRGHIARTEQARVEFKKAHPCPSTGKAYGACPGYVIDHVTPLKRGGSDAPANMQWQTTAEARAKDKWE